MTTEQTQARQNAIKIVDWLRTMNFHLVQVLPEFDKMEVKQTRERFIELLEQHPVISTPSAPPPVVPDGRPENPYADEKKFPVLSDAKLKIASYALEAAGISSPQYTVNIARFVWEEAMRHFPSAPSEPWVSASINPEKAGLYFVVYKGPHKMATTTAYYSNGDGWGAYKHNDYHVTHWQPLPSPPQNQK